jgi:hypothetical protein
MTTLDLFHAKADVIAAFAGGPAIMIEDDSERDRRIASMLALVEMEWEPVDEIKVLTRPIARIGNDVSRHEFNASTTRVNWASLIDELRANPGVSKVVIYDEMHTAVVRAKGIELKYRGVTAMTERRGDAGAIILTCG